MKISVIVPMYNEKDIVDGAIDVYAGYLRDSFDEWELIFVDDGSTDGCGDAVKKASAADGRIKLIRYGVNRGKGCAVRTGMLASDGDIALFTDCDNAYGTEVIGRMAEKFRESGADVVIGSRNLDKSGYEGYTFIRRLASKIYIKVLAVCAGFKLSDSQCGFKGFRHEAALRIFKNCATDRWAFDLEAIMIAQKLGYTIAEMPVRIINHRESKIHVMSDSVKMLGDVMRMKKRIKHTELV